MLCPWISQQLAQERNHILDALPWIPRKTERMLMQDLLPQMLYILRQLRPRWAAMRNSLPSTHLKIAAPSNICLRRRWISMMASLHNPSEDFAPRPSFSSHPLLQRLLALTSKVRAMRKSKLRVRSKKTGKSTFLQRCLRSRRKQYRESHMLVWDWMLWCMTKCSFFVLSVSL